MKLWCIVYKDNRIIKDTMVSSRSLDECIEAACNEFDLEKPVMLKKHEEELKNFSRTSFLPGDFIDSVSFDKFVIEIIKQQNMK